MKTQEINFDGLVGPTHNYSGLSYGNLASMHHKQAVSHPKQAAFEGLKKMKAVMDLGLVQGFFPPQLRPSIPHLKNLGFVGSDAEILQEAQERAPILLACCSSSSNMWAANSATVTPSIDAADGRIHITIANLLNRFHRALEAQETYQLFKTVFPHFVIHPPLPAADHFGDEGAANHIRFCTDYGEPGVHLFVHGMSCFDEQATRYPARQSREAHEAICRRHGLSPHQVVFARQNPQLIEHGIFHNDVISTGNLNLFLYHPEAFVDTPRVLEEIDQKLKGASLDAHALPITIEEAIDSYIFNSQLLTREQILIAPEEAKPHAPKLPLHKVHYSSVHESMQNGGGPACLRLRLTVTEQELSQINPRYLLTPELYPRLVDWVERHYRDRLAPDDLADPSLLEEACAATTALQTLLSE